MATLTGRYFKLDGFEASFHPQRITLKMTIALFSGKRVSNTTNPYGSGLCNEGSFLDAGALPARIQVFICEENDETTITKHSAFIERRNICRIERAR